MSVIFGLTVREDKAFGESTGGWDDIQKALSHKYIRRIPKKNGKGYWYIYAETFLKPLVALKTFFGLQPKSVDETYEKNDIKKDFGTDKKTFAAHILEYLSNKIKWDTFFAKKENQDGYKAPRKSPPAGKKEGGKGGGGVDKNRNQDDNKIVLNRSLMRKIWGIYNKTEEGNGTNDAGIGSRELSDGASAVRPGGGEETGDQYVPSAGSGDNIGESLQPTVNTGDRPARDVRVTKKQTINIREACLALLNSKTDSEMTEEDKALLRQYEGAGGLGENNASVHGTLYEYYTPRTVTKKVWEIVDKYIPGKKNVLEPSAGIGRFAEDRPDDTFTLNEYDKISARIAGILHSDKNVKTGAFQEMFKPGKAYTGEKYDVVIGNPPYGTYEGLWKGRGEGKEHKRYEEYFIDRGLDTIREGGIMAFVVPSSFLRGNNDKIKEKIAAKGKLLEAWRLPNGTFNTTGVGTDIIIIRKEKGDPAAFSNNAFFAEHPDMVMGTEVVRTGRFGKEENFITPADGESFDEAIERIRADKMEAVPIGAKTTAEEADEKVKVEVEKTFLTGETLAQVKQKDSHIRRIAELEDLIEIVKKRLVDGYTSNPYRTTPTKKEIAEMKGSIKYTEKQIADEKRKIAELDSQIKSAENKPKGRSRSEAMMGNQNAAGPHDIDSLAEFNKKYNKNIPEEALPIWKATNWDGSINVTDLQNTQYLEKSGNYVKAADGKWYDIVNFASGNIYQKLKELERDKENLSEADYKRQKAILEAAKPTPRTVFEFTVSPLTDFATKYVLEEELNDKQDSLVEGFKDWVWDLGNDSVPPSITKHDIIDYVNRKQVRAKGKDDEDIAVRDNTIKVRREATENLFNQYIRENLSIQEQERMADMWNKQFNAIAAPDHTKIP
ncbi:MAG: N-6 DNA methylase, partial [Treponema sp.]|nr:N-6 DNA methylase [Treponema sp.]